MNLQGLSVRDRWAVRFIAWCIERLPSRPLAEMITHAIEIGTLHIAREHVLSVIEEHERHLRPNT